MAYLSIAKSPGKGLEGRLNMSGIDWLDVGAGAVLIGIGLLFASFGVAIVAAAAAETVACSCLVDL